MAVTYSPRAVTVVALASLAAGFLGVFGGGMLLMRRPPPRRVPSASVQPGAVAMAPPAAVPLPVEPLADAATATRDMPDATSEAGTLAPPPPEPVAIAGIALGTPSIQRCFDAGPPTPIPAAQCDRLVGIEQHFAARAPQIAACARNGAHGRLSLVLDFRFSTNFMRGWGTPSSSIANAGTVAACVKGAITPLPFASTAHLHDRYVLVEGIEW